MPTAVAALLVGAAFALQPSAGARPAAGRVIDRTVLCSTSTSGGIYEIEARAHAGIRESRSRWKSLSFAVVATGGTGSAATQLDNSLAWITAGRPSNTTLIEEARFPSPVLANGTLALNLGQCTSTRVRVPLTSLGLRGGAASQLGDALDCTSPRRILVRLRATLQSPAKLHQARGFLRTNVPVTEASLAVRTQSGKPLAYATVAESGKARLFTARSCTAD